jgi:transcription initiation factor TFIIB
METPKTFEDIGTITNIKRKSISRNYRLLVNELDLKIPLVDPISCIAKIANKSNLSERTKRKVMMILRTGVTRNVVAGKNPMSFAASVVYLASVYTGEKRTQTDIAKAAGVTEVTVRNRYRDLKTTIGLDSFSLLSKNKTQDNDNKHV